MGKENKDEALMEHADVTAAAEKAAFPAEEERQSDEEIERENPDESADSYIVQFRRTYIWKDEEITQLDMSGLEHLTTRDGEYVDRVLARLNHAPRNKFTDTLYCKHIAVRATGIAMDFFNMLDIRDMLLIVAKVNYYFLFS